MNNQKIKKIKLPFSRAFFMVMSYARGKISQTFKSTAFIVIYLVLVQLLFLRSSIANAVSVGVGIALVVFGLSFFLEGLFLGIMPLGERAGLKLPGNANLFGIILFSVLLGGAATLAEPAVGILKVQGMSILPWEAPLLYYVLNPASFYLVLSICVGVGIAVALGVFRFLKDWPIKPFIYIIIPILLLITYFAGNSQSLKQIIGLAWDTGGITTGPVTVPLVLALGIGVSRISGSGDKASSGLGVVTLASALPVLTVIILGFFVSGSVSLPLEKTDFFKDENRVKAVFTVGSEKALITLAQEKLTEEEFIKAFPHQSYEFPVLNVSSEKSQNELVEKSMSQKLLSVFLDSLKAVIPLSLVLVITLIVFLKDKIQDKDTIFLGLVFAVLGMFMFTFGMESGLSDLGKQSGYSLPNAWKSIERKDATIILHDLNPDFLSKAYKDGKETKVILLSKEIGVEAIPFEEKQFNPITKEYTIIPKEKPLLNWLGSFADITAIILFTFFLGLGATLAEPSLSALGIKIEEITTGTYKKQVLIITVALGVGIGLAIGFARIVYNWNLVYIILGLYGVALLLTLFSNEDFTAIAWDAAGVTTGPVTVPLVLACALGIGGLNNAESAFGVVALASVSPIIAVLISGIISNIKNQKWLAPGAHS